MTDDGVLVRRCLAGDEAALRLFVERFQGPVFGLCCRMLRHRQDAEDTSQEVFLRAFRGLSCWQPGRPLKPWLMMIAANRCRTAIRRRMSRPSAAALLDDPPSGPPWDASTDLGEELERALGRLREDHRQCFVLFHQGELSCARIGRIMGHPAGTIKTWLHRARRELADQLQRRGIVHGVRHEMHDVRT
ncbi:MAG: RNA polymerase sigma factor [Planctomycetaceae bacterium]